MLRHLIIVKRADLRKRLEDVFQKLETSVDDIIDRIEAMKKEKDNYEYAHWNNDELKSVAASGFWDTDDDHYIAKIILWKYENYLISSEGKPGYPPISFDKINKKFHLEHIAPQTENEEAATGYDIYDDDFCNNYLYSLGNFLLLSGPHNVSISNKPFNVKRKSYKELKQQREIQDMTKTDRVWNRKKIAKRQKKIIKFMLDNL